MNGTIYKMRTMSRAAAALLLAGAALLAGCSGLRSSEPVIVSYVLHTPYDTAAVKAAAAPAGGGHSIMVLAPVVAPGLANDGIALQTSDGRLDRYAGSRWADELPRVVADLAVHTLRAAPAIASVSDSGAPFASSHVLRIDVTHFEARYAGTRADGNETPNVMVTLECTLARRDDRAVIATFTASGAQEAAQNRMGGVIAAFDAATRQALIELREKTLAALSAR